MGGDNVLGLLQGLLRFQQVRNELDMTRVHAVFRLLEPHEARGFSCPGQGQQSEHPKRTIREHASRNGCTALFQVQFGFAEVVHIHFDPIDIRHKRVQRFLYGFEPGRISGLERIQKSGQLFTHRAYMRHFPDRGGGTHALARLKVEKAPAFQFAPRRRNMGIIRQVMGHGQDAAIQIPVVISGMRLPLKPHIYLFAFSSEKRLAFTRGLPLAVQDGQGFVRHAQDTGPGQHFDFDAVAQIAFAHLRKPLLAVFGG